MHCRQFARLALYALLLPIGAACAAEADNKIPVEGLRILERATQFELLSLSPDHREEKSPDDFHGWTVLGKTTVKDAQVRGKLVAAFKKGVQDNTGIAAACFDPRHGIRVTHGGKTVDFVVCFECFQVEMFVGGEKKHFLITDSPQAAFDRVLKEAKVPLAAKRTPQSAQAALPSGNAPNAGQRLQLEARVAQVAPGAAWHHYSGGAFDVFDGITFAITDPETMRGEELTVYYRPNRLPDESPLRIIGTRCRFHIAADYFEPLKPDESREIHEGALEELTVLAEGHP